MELKEARYILAIARHQSIGKAAESLYKMCIRDRPLSLLRKKLPHSLLPGFLLLWSLLWMRRRRR